MIEGGRGHEPRNVESLLAGKSNGIDSPLKPPERKKGNPDFGSLRPILAF
jgi:hypothetical protein